MGMLLLPRCTYSSAACFPHGLVVLCASDPLKEGGLCMICCDMPCCSNNDYDNIGADQALQSEAMELHSANVKLGDGPQDINLVQLLSDDRTGNDGLSTAVVPHAVAELWHGLQLSMRRVQVQC